jgi:tetratricopeptide (TPR) repeat protein
MHSIVRFATARVLAFVLMSPAVVAADPSSPAVEQRREPPAGTTAESEYHRGLRARVGRDWKAAEAAFRVALSRQAAFPEAWNELGFTLRNQGRYAESLTAYEEALRLRPDFPEALAYLGEAYLALGRLEDARRLVDRLRVLDAPRARELAEVIDRRK